MWGVQHLDDLEEYMCKTLSNCLGKCMSIIWGWAIGCETLASYCKIVLTIWKRAIIVYFEESCVYILIVGRGDNSFRVYVGQVMWSRFHFRRVIVFTKVGHQLTTIISYLILRVKSWCSKIVPLSPWLYPIDDCEKSWYRNIGFQGESNPWVQLSSENTIVMSVPISWITSHWKIIDIIMITLLDLKLEDNP